MEKPAGSPAFLTTFRRSQVAAFIATVVDYALMVTLVEAAGLWYVAATAVGALMGAVTNFVLNRHWSFEAAHGRFYGQAFRYSLISGISLALNSVGVFIFTDYFGIQYAASRVVTSLLVGLFFNFPLHRGFVFR